jgi:uncharacterized protein YbjT (DUF2867 family)
MSSNERKPFMYLVVGATAHFGRQAVEELVSAGVPVRALTRAPEKSGLPEGVEVVRGDLTKPQTLPAVVQGVEAAFLVLQYGIDVAAMLQAAR